MTSRMTGYEYQLLASRTAPAKPERELTTQEQMLIRHLLGIAGEAGEMIEHVKKGIYHNHGIEPDKLHKEIGDLLWYIAAICDVMEFNLDEVMRQNILKLAERYPSGFSQLRSINRKESQTL